MKLDAEWSKLGFVRQAQDMAEALQDVEHLLQAIYYDAHNLSRAISGLPAGPARKFFDDLSHDIIYDKHMKGSQLLQEAKKSLVPDTLDWGFDLTNFRKGGWAKVLRALRLPTTPRRAGSGAEAQYHWIRPGLTIVTQRNPLDDPKYEDAGYIGITGKPEDVKAAVKAIKTNKAYIKDESKGERGYI